MQTGIYVITNLVNGKKYIGQSIDIQARFIRHKTNGKALKKYVKDSHLYRAMRKYGVNNFSFEILEECPEGKLNEREIYYIDLYKTYDSDYGYNETLGGGGYSKYNKKEIASLWDDGLTISEISRSMGCGRNTVKTALRALGINYEKEALERWVMKKSRGITQYSMCMEKIKEWPSAKEIERTLGFDHSGIGDCCNYMVKQYCGYKWRYTKRSETAAMADLLD